jgi:fibronectin type 3 domain-containing protein
MPKPKFNFQLFVIAALILCLSLFAACESPTGDDSKPAPKKPTVNTWVEFKNLEQYPVTIYGDSSRHRVLTEIAALGSAVVASEPVPAGMAFYPTFRLDIFDMPGIGISYNGESFVAKIEANETNLATVPKLKSIELNFAYIKIVNNSSYSLALKQGSGEKSPLGDGSTIINSGQNAVYDVFPGPISNYSVLSNTTTRVGFPVELTEFKRGIIYVITYNGTSLSLTDKQSVLQIIPPVVPENIRAEMLSKDSVRISWNEVYGATSYRVYRTTGSLDASYSMVANIETLFWADTGLTEGEIYYYRVSALSGGNRESGQSVAVSTVMPPANVRINAVTNSSVSLAWDAVSGADAYNVYRSDSENGNYSKVNTVTIAGTTFTDTGLVSFTVYYYKMSLFSGGAESIQSNAISGKTHLSAPLNMRVSTVTDKTISLEWDAVNGADGYNIYRSNNAIGYYIKIHTSIINGTTFADTGLGAFTTYYYKIGAVATDHESEQSDTISGTTLMSAPSDVRVSAVTDSSVSLTWGIVNGASGYNVYRSDSENGIYTKINTGTVTGIAFTDADISPYAVFYYYKVSAVLGSLEGVQSSTITSVLIVPGNGLVEKLAWLQRNVANNILYSIEQNTDEYIDPQPLSYNGKSGIALLLSGNDVVHTVNLSSRGSLFTVDTGVTLILYNNITLKGISNNDNSLVYVNNGGTLIMNTGAKIIDNDISYYSSRSGGSGVYVDGGTFTMNDGEISGNSSRYGHGGGVYVNGGTFTINGGEIFGNSTNFYNGGGVSVTDGNFTISGGKIYGNSAGGYNGGGVSLTDGSFTISGGEISGNTASYGGGVYVGGGTFTMSGGKIFKTSERRSNGSGVYIYDGTFIMNGGEISENTSGGVRVAGGTFTMSGGEIFENASSGVGVNGGTFTMNDGEIFENTGSGVYVDGGTFTMNDGEISENAGSGVDVNGGTFTMSGGEIFENASSGVGVNGGTFTMNDGEISENTSGGVGVAGGTFTMNGGEISKNTLGGVYIDRGTFTMSGGEIARNTDCGVSVNYYGIFIMDEGKISGHSSYSGGSGGVRVSYYGTFTMNGGEISGNTAHSAIGGGVCVD